MAKIITFEKLTLICKHKMGGCGLRMGSVKQVECSGYACPILRQLPDAEAGELESVKWNLQRWQGFGEKLNRLFRHVCHFVGKEGCPFTSSGHEKCKGDCEDCIVSRMERYYNSLPHLVVDPQNHGVTTNGTAES